MFEKFRKMNIAQRKTDEAFYSIVAQEMENGERNSALWIKALEKADGNKEKQIAEYIKLRVQSLKDDMSIYSDVLTEVKQVTREPDIEHFCVILGDGAPVEKMKSYLSGMSELQVSRFINQPDACDDYPIHIAVKKGRLDIARWLLESGADPNRKNYWGNTALEIAKKNEDQLFLVLLKNYAS